MKKLTLPEFIKKYKVVNYSIAEKEQGILIYVKNSLYKYINPDKCNFRYIVEPNGTKKIIATGIEALECINQIHKNMYEEIDKEWEKKFLDFLHFEYATIKGFKMLLENKEKSYNKILHELIRDKQ